MSTLPPDEPVPPSPRSGWPVLFRILLVAIVPFVGVYLLRLALVSMGVISH